MFMAPSIRLAVNSASLEGAHWMLPESFGTDNVRITRPLANSTISN
jgi:hypothetical protein